MAVVDIGVHTEPAAKHQGRTGSPQDRPLQIRGQPQGLQGLAIKRVMTRRLCGRRCRSLLDRRATHRSGHCLGGLFFWSRSRRRRFGKFLFGNGCTALPAKCRCGWYRHTTIHAKHWLPRQTLKWIFTWRPPMYLALVIERAGAVAIPCAANALAPSRPPLEPFACD